MSVDATIATWKLGKEITAVQKLILLSLADRAGEDAECWPGVKRLCNDTNLDRKTLIENRQSLIEKGLIEYTGEMRGRTSSIPVMRLTYVLHREDKLEISSTENGTGSSTENGTAKQYRKRDTEPNINNLSKEPIISLVDSDESPPVASSKTTTKKPKLYCDDEAFMRFYSAYPKKKQPQSAYKAFRALNPDETMIDAILKDISSKSRFDAQWKNIKYIPHPATYINSRDFESDITPEGDDKKKKPVYDDSSIDWAYPKREERIINERELLL